MRVSEEVVNANERVDEKSLEGGKNSKVIESHTCS